MVAISSIYSSLLDFAAFCLIEKVEEEEREGVR